MRLDRPHLTIQDAMGWTNAHLYMLEAGGATWGLPDPDVGGDDLPAGKTTLAELIDDTGARTISYLKGFGDSWAPLSTEFYSGSECAKRLSGMAPPWQVPVFRC